jgi:phosphopantothenoylcysteine decarboxylase/phosphopantothenate--cysteine ligase
MLDGRTVLLIVGGGIAAYKALELVRLLKGDGARVVPLLTAAGAEFVTPLSLAALAEEPVHTALWDLNAEAQMRHIRLSREADLIVLCPATASRLARMAAGLGEDLADAVLLAADAPVLAVPAMNWAMWGHPATRRNVETLRGWGVEVMEPEEGPMACGEHGSGRLPEPPHILERIRARLAGLPPRQSAGEAGGEGVFRLDPDAGAVRFGDGARGRVPPAGGAGRVGQALRPGAGGGAAGNRPLAGRHAIVTAGPTHEPIDPVRYLGNRSSGRQGFAIAEALARAGARVTLVAGPVSLATPAGVRRVDVVTAREMAAAVEAALPADIAVMVAAVADWGVDGAATHKLKKGDGPPAIRLVPNPDILAQVAAPGPHRPALVIGFAAETQALEQNARAKLLAKGADMIVANDVSGDAMGGAENAVALVTRDGVERWARMDKDSVAARLVERLSGVLATG